MLAELHLLNPKTWRPCWFFRASSKTDRRALVPEFRQNLLNAYLNDLAARVNIWPQNARFIFNDETRQLDLLSSSTMGRSMDVQASFTQLKALFHSARPEQY